jgi:DNA-binding NarL/FixJ family response regulator
MGTRVKEEEVKRCKISERELVVLYWTMCGYRCKEVGERMGLKEITVRNMMVSIREKMGLGSNMGCVLVALNRGWLLFPLEEELV